MLAIVGIEVMGWRRRRKLIINQRVGGFVQADKNHFRKAIAHANASAPPTANVEKARPHDTETGVMSSAMPNAMGETEPAPTPKIDRKPSARPSCDAGMASVMAEESTE